MNEIITPSAAVTVPLSPRRDVSIRVATMADLPFLDAMQKMHGRALGYFPTKQFEGYIAMGGVLIAHDGATPLGYCISRDRYLKRDELGVIYQLCVAPGEQRKLVGAALVRDAFERSAYGCRLYCCWCAQDLEANWFWESLGFVPIAFRGGSGKKKRVHIFWQRRIRAGDTGERATPWWFPAKTESGAIREDRLVLPIPPGLHWRDPMPVLKAAASGPSSEKAAKAKRTPEVGAKGGPQTPTPRPRAAVQFGVPTAGRPVAVEATAATQPPPQPKREPKHKVTIDPAMVSKARELRDRYLERVNERLLIAPGGKYDVSRQLAAPSTTAALTTKENPRPLLDAA